MAGTFDALMSDEGRRAFDRALAARVRAGRDEEADAILTRLLAAAPSEHAAACLGLSAEAITIGGWDLFNARIEEISARGGAVTAVGIDITDQGDLEDAHGRREQALETVYYDASCGFDFAAAGREGLLAATATGLETPPWAGAFAEIDGSVSVRGLAPVYDLLLRRPERPWRAAMSEQERWENLGAYLASWFRHLRVHQAVRRELEAGGLTRNIPVIVGTNEVSPFFDAIYYPEKLRDDGQAGARLAEAKAAASSAAYAAHTEEQIARWREQREAIRGWSARVNPDQRRRFID